MDIEFVNLMNKLPSNYTISEASKYKSLTKTQIVYLIKKFMEKDTENKCKFRSYLLLLLLIY